MERCLHCYLQWVSAFGSHCCTPAAISVASISLAASLHLQHSQVLSWTALSSVRPCPICGSSSTQGKGGYSPLPGKYWSPWILDPGGGRVHSPVWGRGHRDKSGCRDVAASVTSSKEDILISSNWLLLQICAARCAGLGSSSCSRRAWVTYPQVPLQVGRHSHTHSHTFICAYALSHLLSLTWSWIFELISLWFSCKTDMGLRANGWSFQLLCRHLRTWYNPNTIFLISSSFLISKCSFQIILLLFHGTYISFSFLGYLVLASCLHFLP